MSMHSMFRAVVIVGMALGAGACATRSAEAQSASGAQRENVQKHQQCGGFAGLPCPEPLVCVDDPSDDCDPKQGGRDCMGICQEDTQGSRCEDPRRYYVSKDPERCALVRFVCPPPTDEQHADKTNFFSDDCGCGCESAP
ncbi:hypothetical protein [Melittangium boletus]|uniref:Lipoprotein n=1 Tax=Melittangium boletus DSM 14713 TaxID=1294270 RepID=A0A250ING2_9BACT|nr:hypothetical protein [Melittangium boletus]ATB32793.1 hypothetical protein MEBOL_006282 [Melittangium boletus DSM 14713]